MVASRALFASISKGGFHYPGVDTRDMFTRRANSGAVKVVGIMQSTCSAPNGHKTPGSLQNGSSLKEDLHENRRRRPVFSTSALYVESKCSGPAISRVLFGPALLMTTLSVYLTHPLPCLQHKPFDGVVFHQDACGQSMPPS